MPMPRRFRGRQDEKAGGLAPRTVGYIHRVLKQALSQAVHWEELARNPLMLSIRRMAPHADL
jgi:DNA-binding transcriptional regulator YdaS (Cro superfamily)